MIVSITIPQPIGYPQGHPGLRDQAGDEQLPEELLIGMLRAKTTGKGTPYIADQVCMLCHHLSDSPVVTILIANEEVKLQNFRPAAGTKPGRAKWWDAWVR